MPIAVCVLLAACGSEDKKIGDPDLPYSFAYPDDFSASGEANLREAGVQGYGNQTVIAKGDGRDLVSVQTQPLKRRYTPDLLPRVKRELERSARDSGTVQSSREVEAGGTRGVEFRLEIRAATSTTGASWTYLPKDQTLYWIACQWQSEREAVLDACGEVLKTFETRDPGTGE